jgi:hypothetical protein
MESDQDGLVNEWKPVTSEYANAAAPPAEVERPPEETVPAKPGPSQGNGSMIAIWIAAYQFLRAAVLLLGAVGLSRMGNADVDFAAHPGFRALYFLSPVSFMSQYGYKHSWILYKDYFDSVFTTHEPVGILFLGFLLFAGWFIAFGIGILTRSNLARLGVSATFSIEVVKVLYLFIEAPSGSLTTPLALQALMGFVVIVDLLLLLGLMYLKADASDPDADSGLGSVGIG